MSPPEITRYKLADAAEAHRVSEGRHLQGKLVFEDPLSRRGEETWQTMGKRSSTLTKNA